MTDDSKCDDGRFASFPATAWTLIREIQAKPASQRRESLGEALRPYWKPVYAYLIAKGRQPHEAEDDVQGFLYEFVKGERILRVAQEAGRFRDFVMVCARHFMIDTVRRERAQKRRPAEGKQRFSFEDLQVADGDPFEPSIDDAPEMTFRKAWRRDLVAKALTTVLEVCRDKNREVDYQIFVDRYMSTKSANWAEITERYGLTGFQQAARKAEWVLDQLGRAIRNEIGKYVDGVGDVDDEIRDLLY